MSGLRKILSNIFHDKCLQYYQYNLGSEYGRVLNMLTLHMALNKIFHNRYMNMCYVLWICLEFWICQSYIGICRKHHIMHVWQSISRVLIMLGLEYTSVVNMPRLHRALCKLYFKDSRYLEYLEFWICYGFECIGSLNML